MQNHANRLVEPSQAPWRDSVRGRLPAIALLILIAASSLAICRALSAIVVSPLIVALAIGALIRNALGALSVATDAIKSTTRHALRSGVVVLGLQLSLGQVMAMGVDGAVIVGATLIATFFATLWLGSRLGVERGLTQLIAAGTSICGASAIVAANTVARAAEEDVGYAVAAVSIFGTVSVLLYPFLGQSLQMTADTYGLWVGASIHEIGQVAAAADAWKSSSDVAMVAKLSRVMLLAPVVLLLAALAGRTHAQRHEAPRIEWPWFLVGFLATMLVGSTDHVPPQYKQWGAHTATALLTLALAGLGLELDLRKLWSRGWRPLALGAISSIFICIGSLTGILLLK